MKRTWIVIGALFLVSSTGSAQTASQALLTPEALAAILDQPAATGNCPDPQGEALFAAKRPRLGSERPGSGLLKTACTVTANCNFSTLSCQGNSSCSGVDQNCPIRREGSITCDGVTTSCPACCSGNSKQVACCWCTWTSECYDCCICGGHSTTYCALHC